MIHLFFKGNLHQIATYLNCNCNTLMVIVAKRSMRKFVLSETFDYLCYRVASSEAVNYRTLSLKDLVKSVMAEGGWSDLLVRPVSIFY